MSQKRSYSQQSCNIIVEKKWFAGDSTPLPLATSHSSHLAGSAASCASHTGDLNLLPQWKRAGPPLWDWRLAWIISTEILQSYNCLKLDKQFCRQHQDWRLTPSIFKYAGATSKSVQKQNKNRKTADSVAFKCKITYSIKEWDDEIPDIG